jgi:hypothetical protein
VRGFHVSFGIKTLLLLFATLLFVFAVFSPSKDFENLIGWGLAVVAFSFLLADIGWDRRYGGGRRD